MDTATIGQLGGVFLLAMAMLRILENLITLLINKFTKQGNGQNQVNERIVSELRLMNSNHLNHIQTAIETGNKEIVNAINASKDAQIEAYTNANLAFALKIGEILGRQK